MDRNRDLAQGLSRIENKVGGKYKSIRVTPTLDTSAYANGDVLFKPIEIKNVCVPGETSLLKQIKMFCLDDEGKDVDLLFFESEPTVEDLNAASSTFHVTGGDVADNVLLQVNPLGTVILDVNGSNTTVFDYTNSKMYIQTSVDIYVKSGTGSIFVMGVATGSDTYTAANDLVFEFVFERY